MHEDSKLLKQEGEMTFAKIKLIAAGLTALALVGAGWMARGILADRDLTKAVARAEAAENRADDLAEANHRLEAANQNCNRAATEQSAIAADGLDQRGLLAEIMRATSPGLGPTAGEFKGAPLNDAQKIQLIGFYNSFFADSGSLRVN
jgi:hypothetical protein